MNKNKSNEKKIRIASLSPLCRKRSPKPVTDNDNVANANVKTPWNAATSEVYKALMEEKTGRFELLHKAL